MKYFIILCTVLLSSCHSFIFGSIEKGKQCKVTYEVYKENNHDSDNHDFVEHRTAEGNIYYIRNTATRIKLLFTVKEKYSISGTYTPDFDSNENYAIFILQPGERKEIGCSVARDSCCNYYSYSYEIVGDRVIKEKTNSPYSY